LALPSIYEYCEAEGIYYTIGLISNLRLEELAAPLVSVASLGSIVCLRRGEDPKVRLFSETSYAAGSWSKERRVVYKAEIVHKGVNTRFVLTNRKESSAQELYESYVQRGETENRIKDYKNGLKADRLSCCSFLANQLWLFLHAAAYWLLDVLRERLAGKGFRRMQLETLRLKVIKIGGRVKQLVRKIRVHLASGHPGRRMWQALASTAEGAHE
jgi:hypothetical protein